MGPALLALAQTAVQVNIGETPIHTINALANALRIATHARDPPRALAQAGIAEETTLRNATPGSRN